MHCKKNLFDALGPETIIIHSKAVEIPACRATIVPLDFSTLKISVQYQAIAIISKLAWKYLLIRTEELDSALKMRFVPPVLDALLKLSVSLKCKCSGDPEIRPDGWSRDTLQTAPAVTIMGP